jgi:hypothetical protein
MVKDQHKVVSKLEKHKVPNFLLQLVPVAEVWITNLAFYESVIKERTVKGRSACAVLNETQVHRIRAWTQSYIVSFG